jgi:hypothetical protein
MKFRCRVRHFKHTEQNRRQRSNNRVAVVSGAAALHQNTLNGKNPRYSCTYLLLTSDHEWQLRDTNIDPDKFQYRNTVCSCYLL